MLVVAAAPSAGSAKSRGTMTPVTKLQTALLGQINGFRASHGLTSGFLALGLPARQAA